MINRNGVWLAGTVFLVSQVNAVEIFSEDFESGPLGTEWSTNVGSLTIDTAPNGQNILGADDANPDGLSNQAVTLSLSGLASHSTLSLMFDLIVIDSMDGDEPFSLMIDGAAQLGSPVMFDNVPVRGTTLAAGFGSLLSTDTHGFALVNSASASDSVYRISLDLAHTASAVDLVFSYSGLQGILDESWSLDNLLLEIDGAIDPPTEPTVDVPEPSTWWLLSAGLVGVLGVRRVSRERVERALST